MEKTTGKFEYESTNFPKPIFGLTDWRINFISYGEHHEPDADEELLWLQFESRVNHLINIVNDTLIPGQQNNYDDRLLSHYLMAIDRRDEGKHIFRAQIYIKNPTKDLSELTCRIQDVYILWGKAERKYNHKLKLNKERYLLQMELLDKYYDVASTPIPKHIRHKTVI